MNPVKAILAKLNGLHYRQDFLCMAGEKLSQPLQAYIVANGKIVANITTRHAFVGYCPVVIALPLLAEINEKEVIEVALTLDCYELQKPFHLDDALAQLTLQPIRRQQAGSDGIIYYSCTGGKHKFVSAVHQSIGQLYNNLYNQKPGNVFLKGNLNKQVQIAYALARKISLITVGINYAYNLFPTDLHGQVTPSHYIISLRHEGKACKQVTAAQYIVLSDMRADAYQTVYSLGKNHMQPLKDVALFPFSSKVSLTFQLPLPEGAVGCKELQLQDCFDVGIHKIMLFKIIGRQNFTPRPETLVHVHNVYATWRLQQGLSGNYLLR